uniref:NADH dehydrogenase subunit 6 n=1 Tax=Bunostomum phlebotomum TaxID=577651 RepID=S5FVH5_9BILA|nr:NADH dehydrogenase subunits 6 [Bunostomum phlebotomum]QOW40485.1 NADH dehydrogenase subunit 6 [Bunostomum phlebotomum]
MFSFFLLFSLLGGVLSYLNIDPMKSSFFLIMSMMMCMPLLSFMGYVWFSYFICLLFLSGIFVILVYFSSLSKFSLVSGFLWFLAFVLSFLVLGMNFNVNVGLINLNVFYYSIYWLVLFFIFFVLLFFMNFTSFFLNFSGALRKV